MIALMRFKHLLIGFFLMGLGVSLSGCWFIYKPDIKQGNILTMQKVHAIQPGMNKDQVIGILGNPILVNVFADNQMIYVYTIQPGHGHFQAQQLRIYFANGRVTSYTSSVR
jgi:outer membrane protein assembly factor BamE